MSMTIQEAIKQLDGAEVLLLNRKDFVFNKAIIMAIDALREKAEREDPQPLTIEELQQMDGEPVWVKNRNADRGEGEWCVICLYYNKLDFDASIPGVESYWHPSNEYGKTWTAYRHKPKEV